MTRRTHNLLRSLAFTLAALFLYVPVNLYPFMTMNYFGKYQYTTIWEGVRSLFDSGMWATATIVFSASIIIPLFKLVALLFVIISDLFRFAPTWCVSLLKFVDFIGRWSMLDVFLLSIMVALIKFGSFATVTADMSSYMLGMVVIFTMLASATLNNQAMEDEAL